MTDQKPPSNVSLTDNAASNAKGWADTADTLFTVAERVLVVGAVKYAASAVPNGSAAQISLATAAAYLNLLLCVWITTRLAVPIAAIVDWLRARVKTRFDWRPHSTVSLAVYVVVFVGSLLALNSIVTGTLNGIIEGLSEAAAKQ
jgi:hypothetical protein